MEKFDVTFKYTVVGVRTVEAKDKESAMQGTRIVIQDGVSATHEASAIIKSINGSVFEHDHGSIEIELADLKRRRDIGYTCTVKKRETYG